MKNILLKRNHIRSFVIIVSLIVLTYYIFVGIWPFIFNLYMSFSKSDLSGNWIFVGLNNYKFLFRDPVFLKALINNFMYLIIMVTIGMVSSLIIAGFIKRTSGLAKKIYIALFFAPVVTSLVAVSMVWKLLYYPEVGIFAKMILSMFPVSPPRFLADPNTALLSIIIMDVWKETGLRVIILHAGMEEIPESIYDSSRIDGASSITQFFKITIPLIRPQIIFLIAIYSINALRVFTQIYMMTTSPPGGPMNSTQVLVVKLYLEAFRSFKAGTGAVISLVIFILLFGLVLMEIKSFQQKWEY